MNQETDNFQSLSEVSSLESAQTPPVAPEQLLVRWKHLGFILLVLVSLIAAATTFLIDVGIVMIGLLGFITAALTVLYPVVGLFIFQIITYIRPGDFSEGLAVLPIAKIVGGGTLVVLIVRAAISKSFVIRSRQTVLMFGLLLALFLSIPLSYWPTRSFDVAFDFLKTILFFVLFINLIKDIRTLRAISTITLVCALVLAGSSIIGSLGSTSRVGTSIGSGLFGDANDAAQLFVAAVPLVGLWRVSDLRSLLPRVFVGGSLALLLSSTVMTQSRGGFLGLLAVIFAYFVQGKNLIRGMAIVAILGAVIIALAPASTTQRYQTIQSYGEDASAMSRLYTWKAGLNMLLSRPFTGVGAGAFEVAFGTAYRPAGYMGNKWNAPHNTLVQVGGETGFPGLIVFVYLIGYSMFQLKRLKPSGNEEERATISRLSHIFFASFVGWGVCAMFLTQAFSPYLYFLIASTVVLVKINDRLAAAENKNGGKVGSKEAPSADSNLADR